MVKAQTEMSNMDAKKKSDVLSKARNKLFSFGSRQNLDVDELRMPKKSVTQATFDYFFKHGPRDKRQGLQGNQKLTKQNSIGGYPIRIEVEEYDDFNHVVDDRASTLCVDKINENRDTAALALERPRKKLSFREPEISGYAKNAHKDLRIKKNQAKCLDVPTATGMKRSISFTNGILHRPPSIDDVDLENQAMRVVRTIGQAFEVCHKLSINAPEPDNLDPDEQDTLTQDLVSDRLSDITTDKNKKDILSEGASDKISLPTDDTSFKELQYQENCKNSRPPQLDLLPPPPPTTNAKNSPLTSAETYSSPHSDMLTSGSGSGDRSLPPAGSALSAHHEIQLLKEQLDQQTQQTQAAMAQLQLAREQLAAEQSARLEAQARTHQLLVHNRELLDHIAALVSHLQGGEKSSQQQTPPHVTLPQHHPPVADNYMAEQAENLQMDSGSIYQALGLNAQGLIENRAVTSCLPTSPLCSYNPSGGVFNFQYPPAPPMDPTFEAQLLQRLQSLNSYGPPAYNYSQTLPYLKPNLYSQTILNNNYPLQPPPLKKYGSSPLNVRHSFPEGTLGDQRQSPARNSEPRQVNYQSTQNLTMQNQNLLQHHNLLQNTNYQLHQNLLNSHQHLEPPKMQQQQQQHLHQHQNHSEGNLIKPLSQMGTLTTTDVEGRVKIIVPVPSSSGEDTRNLLANLRISDDVKVGGPITRSTSEKVPNRSELMSQVQRTAWARHTTK